MHAGRFGTFPHSFVPDNLALSLDSLSGGLLSSLTSPPLILFLLSFPLSLCSLSLYSLSFLLGGANYSTAPGPLQGLSRASGNYCVYSEPQGLAPKPLSQEGSDLKFHGPDGCCLVPSSSPLPVLARFGGVGGDRWGRRGGRRLGGGCGATGKVWLGKEPVNLAR